MLTRLSRVKRKLLNDCSLREAPDLQRIAAWSSLDNYKQTRVYAEWGTCDGDALTITSSHRLLLLLLKHTASTASLWTCRSACDYSHWQKKKTVKKSTFFWSTHKLNNFMNGLILAEALRRSRMLRVLWLSRRYQNLSFPLVHNLCITVRKSGQHNSTVRKGAYKATEMNWTELSCQFVRLATQLNRPFSSLQFCRFG